jgi:hypothetical protein
MIKLVVKNSISSIKNKIISRYLVEDINADQSKSTDINILLNRVRLDKKKESRKKIFFSTVVTFGIFMFGVAIF